MEFSSAELSTWITGALWPLTRVAAALSVAPIFSVRSMPMQARLIAALVITWAVLPLVDTASIPVVEPISVAGVLITAQQIMIGLAIGFLLRLVFTALELGGQFISIQMGLGFANLVDPQSGSQIPLLSHFYHICGVLILLAIDGHLLLIQLLADSFSALPIGVSGLTREHYWLLANWGTRMFAGAVLLALPALAALLLVNLAFGVLTRAAPQLNIFAVGFPLTLLLGLFIVLYSLPILLPQIRELVEAALTTGYQITTP